MALRLQNRRVTSKWRGPPAEAAGAEPQNSQLLFGRYITRNKIVQTNRFAIFANQCLNWLAVNPF